MSSHKAKKYPESISIHGLDAAACVTAARRPLKQFMGSKLHKMILPIPIVVSNSSPDFSTWSGIPVADD